MHHCCRLKNWALQIFFRKKTVFYQFRFFISSDILIFLLTQFRTHCWNKAWGMLIFVPSLINYTFRKSLQNMRQKSVILLGTHPLTPLLSNPFCMLFFPPSTMVAVTLLHGRLTYDDARLKFTRTLIEKKYETRLYRYIPLVRMYVNNYNNVRKLFSIALLYVR